MSGNYKVYSSNCESYEYENIKNVLLNVNGVYEVNRTIH